MKLKGKRAIVTGATKGIGLAIARDLVGAGSDVVVSSRSADDVRATAEALAESGSSRVIGTVCDVGDAGSVRNLIESCVAELGGLEILINNAGIGIFKPAAEMTPEQWRQTIATNLDGVFFGCHYAIPHLKAAGEGFIINISSLAGKNAFVGGTAYNASKFGLTGLSEALMQEVRHDNIQVAYVMPGSVDTDFSGRSQGESSWRLSAQDVSDVVLDTLRRHPRCLTSRIEMRPSRPPRK